MIKILHVVNWLEYGGIETQLLYILKNYDRNIFHMDVCCVGGKAGSLADTVKELGSEILLCRKSANFFSFSRRFQKVVQSKGYHVVHVHGELISGPVLRGAAQANIPIRISHVRSSSVGHSAGRIHILYRIAVGMLARFSAAWTDKYAVRIIGVSQAALDARWPGWRKHRNKFHVWTLGVNTEIFIPAAESPQSLSNRNMHIVSVANFKQLKRHDLMLEIFSRIAVRFSNVSLMLVGEGELRKGIENKACSLGLRERVMFLDTRKDIPAVLQKADIFMSCSEIEGLPNALIEAIACGIPVAATDIAPHREALPPVMHPFLFPADRKDRAAEILSQLLEQEQLRRETGRAGRAWALKKFSAQKNLSILLKVYTDSTVEAYS